MGKTILIADDSITIQKVIELTFMARDDQLVVVSDGQAAIAKLGQGRPDLVIADVNMPKVDGYEVCRQAKELYPGIPVLLLAGTFEPFDPKKADAAGAASHLKKPFDSQQLLELVDTLLGPETASAPSSPQLVETVDYYNLRLGCVLLIVAIVIVAALFILL